MIFKSLINAAEQKLFNKMKVKVGQGDYVIRSVFMSFTMLSETELNTVGISCYVQHKVVIGQHLMT